LDTEFVTTGTNEPRPDSRDQGQIAGSLVGQRGLGEHAQRQEISGNSTMTHGAKAVLLRQFETAWKLASFHLTGLTTSECLWRPAIVGPHVHPSTTGGWRADWPTREDYEIGPPSIAWTTWHLGFWWAMVLDHSFGAGTLVREDVTWPGSGEGVRTWIEHLQNEWRANIEPLTDLDLMSENRTHWPMRGRPFGDVVAWVNVELTKNASEIGFVRFLYAARKSDD
jgi:hypothetical protein